jgi:hypothetical protein
VACSSYLIRGLGVACCIALSQVAFSLCVKGCYGLLRFIEASGFQLVYGQGGQDEACVEAGPA